MESPNMDKFLIGLIGVVVGSALTVLREYFSEWRARRANARYLAVRLTCLLENFIGECFDVACDDGQYDERGCLCPKVSAPKLNFDDIDGKWQSLPFDLMYEILNLPNNLNSSNEQISLAIVYGDCAPDYVDFYNERKYQFSVLGLKAATLSNKLRKNILCLVNHTVIGNQ